MFLKVVVKLAATVSMDLLNQLCSQGSKNLTPLPDVQDVQTAIQALDVILRHQTALRPGYVMINEADFLETIFSHLSQEASVQCVTR